MKLPKLIGITGAAGSGKDTLADFLAPRSVKYSFARPLKRALNAMFGWEMAQWDDRDWKEAVQPWLGKSPRQLAQTLGTEWGRESVHPELWILLARRELETLRQVFPTQAIVIPDCRFDNEAQLIEELGGVVIKIVRPGLASVTAHKSEAGVSQKFISCHIVNAWGPEVYLNAALEFLNRWAEEELPADYAV